MLLYENILYKLLLILHHNVYFSLSFPFSVFHTPFIYPFLHPSFILTYTLHLSFPTFYFSSPLSSFLHPSSLSPSPAPQSPPLSPSHIPIIFCPPPFQILISYPNPIPNIWLLPYSWYPGLLVSWYPRHSISNLTLWLCFSFYLFIFIKILYINISI